MVDRAIAAGIVWLQLTGLDGQPIDINPETIVSLRPPRGGFGEDVNCLIHTTDGKFITVVEACDAIRKLEKRNVDK